MKVSLNWLKKYVDIKADVKELSEKLSLAGLEVEAIKTIGDLSDNIVVAEILSREKHPNADRLSLCKVNVGKDADLQIICGASNCDAGLKVPVALIGAEMPGGMKIKKTKLRGILSEGMICSSVELGLAENAEGILKLGTESRVGANIKEIFKADTVIEIEVTPNRPDWLSHIGVAREIAAIEKTKLKLPKLNLLEEADISVHELASVEIKDQELCPRYTARVIKDVTIKSSPDWLKDALLSVGLRPINNVVDITNYVMLECGQPLHAFDYNKLADHLIVVRTADKNEKITTLDETELSLTSKNLLIADSEKAVALAGIMGGATSEIDLRTTDILLESAAFNATNIRRTAKELGLSTDSSHRFERGCDFDMVEFASARATQLLCELTGGKLASGMIDVKAESKSAEIVCRYDAVNKTLGTDISSVEIVSIFERLELPIVKENTQSCTIKCPSFRLDLEREIDLIEEIARIYGLNNIPAVPILARIGGERKEDSYYKMQNIRENLLALGLDECMNYSFINKNDALKNTGITEDSLVELLNPISEDMAVMRPVMLPSMLKVLNHNISRKNNDLSIFEIGKTIVRNKNKISEAYQTCILVSGRVHPERYSTEKAREYDFYDLKGIVEGFLDAQGNSDYRFEPVNSKMFSDGISAELFLADKRIGILGEVSDKLTSGMRLQYPVFAALINIEKLLDLKVPVPSHKDIPATPSTTRDISFTCTNSLTHQEVIDAVRDFDCTVLESVELFDIFYDKSIGENKKSMAYSFIYRDSMKTLKDKTVNKIHCKLTNHLISSLDIEIR
ncbi:MAG: phenylalanine--tRNA ligase subunit beta [Verrucomicrobiota bacterium]|nr:phenylalanine--tRNA ligase subunit beta [Verrucomicrobiota bacterium]